MKRIILALFLFLIFLPNIMALEAMTRCVNSTHLETITEWSESGTDYNITQTINCTKPYDSTERCDDTINQCKYVKKGETGDVVVFGIATFFTGTFFFLGLKANPGKEFSILKSGLQFLFFGLGLFMLLLDAGLGHTIAVSTGVSENTMNIINMTVKVLSYVVYFVMALLILSFLVSVALMWMPRKR